jgi:hypothetical protein
MGFLLTVVTYGAGYLLLLLFALSISVGLYFAAELAEEYPSATGKALKIAMGSVFTLHLILLIDGIPFFKVFISLLCNVAYAFLLKDYPFIQLASLPSLLSLVSFVVSHYIWFDYFLYDRQDIFVLLGFFFLIVWLIPFSLFISLSVNDNILPGISAPNSSNGINGPRRGTNMFKFVFDSIKGFFDKLGLVSKLNSVSKSFSGSNNKYL